MMHVLTVATQGPACHDITAELADWLRSGGAVRGVLTLIVQHTSASLLIQENADPEVQAVFRDRLVPALEYFSDPMDWTQAAELWWQGEYGLYFMGNWLTGMVDEPSDLGVFPLPGTKGMVAATDYAFIPRHSPRVDKAKELLAFLIGREGMELRAKQGGKLSNRTDVPADAHPDVDRQVAELLEGVELLPDLDDAIGGDWQRTFWDQLKLLWVQPDQWQGVLERLEQERGR